MFNFSKSDKELKDDVNSELAWDPQVTPARITVTAKNGVVILRGSVPHYFEKVSAEEAARRVSGVRAVVDEMEVNLLGFYQKSDEDIAEAALNALKWNYSVPDTIQVTVDRAWVTLTGTTDWEFERVAALNAVSMLMGVRGVTNQMTLSPKVEEADVKTRIEEALKRAADTDGLAVKVAVDGTKVTLSGQVHSNSEIEDARVAAWNAPGVMAVQNNLTLTPVL